MKYCPECGEKIEEVRKFCPECGFKFSSQTKLEDTSSVVPIPEKSEPVQQIKSKPLGEIEKKSVGQGTKKVALIFGIIFIVIIILASAWYMSIQHPNYYTPNPPTWQSIDSFYLEYGQMRHISVNAEQWRMRWIFHSGSTLSATLNSGTPGNPVFDTIYATQDGEKVYTGYFEGYLNINSQGTCYFYIEVYR